MIRLEDLVEKVKAANPEADVELLRRAYVFSALEHKGQVRRSGEPYLVHPLEVADLLAEMRLDPVAVAAGLLHDIVEDTPTTIDKIRELFGEKVAHVVEGVTKLSALQFSSSEERQAESFRKMLLAMVDDIRVILVKLADRLHNMRTLEHLPEERRLRIAQETREIYAPIAHRLGMSKIKNELEELAFRHLEPQAYAALRQQVEEKRGVTEGLIEELRQTIAKTLTEGQIPFVSIDGRTKRLFSIYQKLKRQRISLDQVYDFVAMRIVTESLPGCYAALGLIHQIWSPVPGRFKDFIAMPRPNGYQSLHTSVVSDRGMPFEVQIRTEEMHHVAEEGIAAHWKYKVGRVGAERDELQFQWLRQLLEIQQEVRDPHEFLQNLRIELYPDDVYIFTPKGEVRSLPVASTPLDFAYSIHTDVGHQCVGAKVNGRMVPLRSTLENGDIVEIVTQTGHTPSRDSLNVVKTSRAKNKIKHFLHAQEKVKAVELGKRLFDKDVKRFSIDKALVTPEALAKVGADYGAPKAEDLYAAIAYGKILPRAVLGRLIGQESLGEPAPENPISSAVKRVFGGGEQKIKVKGVDDVMVFLARCCNPIRGEKIVGYITRGKGVSVHAASCTNLSHYAPERRIGVEWDAGSAPASGHSVRLRIRVEDRRGILAEVSSRISDVDTNISEIEATTDKEHRGLIRITVQISDVAHLQRVVRSIKKIDGVLDVERAAK